MEQKQTSIEQFAFVLGQPYPRVSAYVKTEEGNDDFSNFLSQLYGCDHYANDLYFHVCVRYADKIIRTGVMRFDSMDALHEWEFPIVDSDPLYGVTTRAISRRAIEEQEREIKEHTYHADK